VTPDWGISIPFFYFSHLGILIVNPPDAKIYPNIEIHIKDDTIYIKPD
jgi:hypothetical protein